MRLAPPEPLTAPARPQVRWEFWTNSNDACGTNCDSQKQFIKEFAPIAKKMDKEDVADFEPHYLIWVCPPRFQDSPQCQSQCIYSGRYCCPDPEDDMDKGYDGKDVILVPPRPPPPPIPPFPPPPFPALAVALPEECV